MRLSLDLSPGDHIVHRDHGIGQFVHLETVEVNNIPHDCVKLLYADNQRLFVPIEHFDVISRYGGPDMQVTLDQLGVTHFQKRKAKAQKRVNDIAAHLMVIAAKRKQCITEPVYYDMHAYQRFCQTFPYTETQDQARAIQEIFGDLQSGHVMDRIVCGDAGFGKTEVAMRAVFAMLAWGKQVAILVPTTTLCKQHYDSFKQRFADHHIAMLCRLTRDPKAIDYNALDVLIGTHALLSDKIHLPRLGLVVVDEEHRFGVTQKEKLKRLYRDVHILSLSATPIPRTLYLSLSGVKDMSLLSTPPVNRQAIQTHIGPLNDVQLKNVIEAEIQRKGQVFWVVPRIKDLDHLLHRLQALMPEVRVALAHGQMPVHQIEEVMIRFTSGDYDVLLATNIIESGIDIKNANTIIIHDACCFGLAQLYQLRGRVGRCEVQAHAYLTYASEKELSPQARKRLEVIQTLDKLGIGFAIASNDMDIRGYGNIIGEEQSGHIEGIGIDLYQHMLENALSQKTEDIYSPQIHLNVPVLIPPAYIANDNLRLSIYQAIARLQDKKEIEAYRLELENQFGPVPQEVANFLDIIEIKRLCLQLNIEKIAQGPKETRMMFRKGHIKNEQKWTAFLKTSWAEKYIIVQPDLSISIQGRCAPKVIKSLVGCLV